MIQNDNPFKALAGEEINAVCVVMDYGEFHFNAPFRGLCRIRSVSLRVRSASSCCRVREMLFVL